MSNFLSHGSKPSAFPLPTWEIKKKIQKCLCSHFPTPHSISLLELLLSTWQLEFFSFVFLGVKCLPEDLQSVSGWKGWNQCWLLSPLPFSFPNCGISPSPTSRWHTSIKHMTTPVEKPVPFTAPWNTGLSMAKFHLDLIFYFSALGSELRVFLIVGKSVTWPTSFIHQR